MRVFIAVLVLIFSLQSWTKADDIRDFEIEGMSIGDSALDFFSLQEIKENSKPDYYTYKKDFSFLAIEIENHKSFKQYFGIQFHVKKNDKNFKIYNLSGYDYCLEDIDDCYNMQKKIEKDFLKIFNDLEVRKNVVTHPADNSGESKVKYIEYRFKNRDTISINVYDWSDKMKHNDNYDVSIDTYEFLLALNQ